MSESTGRLAWTRLIVAIVSRAVVLTLVGAALWMTLPALWGWTSTTVMSDSMAPGIRAGDIVVAMPVPAAQLQPGRVVLVKDPDHPGRLRLHRLVAIDGGELTTRGDANPQNDSTPVARTAVVGVGVLRVPWIGGPFVWAGQGRWEFTALAAGAIGILAMLCGLDTDLRSRRHVLVRPHRAPRLATATLAGVVVLAVSAAPALGFGAHAAYATATGTPGSGFSAAAAYDCLLPTPPDGPVLSLPFNEPSGTTTADRSGNSNTGTLQAGASRVVGSCVAGSSPAIALNGTNSAAVTTTTSAFSPGTYSTEIWFQTTSSTGGRLIGFGSAQTGTSSSYDRHLYLSPLGKVVFGAFGVIAPVTVVSPLSYNDGAWHHAVATMDGGLFGAGMKLYVDGALVGSNGNTASQLTTGYWRVGYDNLANWGSTTPTTFGLTGTVDDAAVYSTVLSATKVAAHYTAGRF